MKLIIKKFSKNDYSSWSDPALIQKIMAIVPELKSPDQGKIRTKKQWNALKDAGLDVPGEVCSMTAKELYQFINRRKKFRAQAPEWIRPIQQMFDTLCKELKADWDDKVLTYVVPDDKFLKSTYDKCLKCIKKLPQEIVDQLTGKVTWTNCDILQKLTDNNQDRLEDLKESKYNSEAKDFASQGKSIIYVDQMFLGDTTSGDPDQLHLNFLELIKGIVIILE